MEGQVQILKYIQHLRPNTIMSLIKLDSRGRLKESWVSKKTTKRLESILKKLRLRYTQLLSIYTICKNYKLPYKEAYNMYIEYIGRAAQLDRYIKKNRNE